MSVVQRFRGYGLTVVAVGAALALAWAFGEAAIWLVLAVLGSSLYGGFGPGIGAVVLSAGALIPFFPEPHLPTFLGAALSVVALVEARRRADIKEREAEQTLNTRLTVDRFPGMVATLSVKGEPEFPNSRLLDYLGKTAEELKNWPSMIHPMDRDRVVRAFTESIATGGPLDVEHRCVCADGSYRWLKNGSLAMYDKKGQIVRWYHLITDIDDRKRAEEALRASELNFQMIVDNIPGMVGTMTAAGELEFANRQVLTFLGTTLEGLRDWGRYLHPEDRDWVVAIYQRALETGGDLDFECRVLRADGTYRWLHYRGHPRRDSEGNVTRRYFLQTDIHDRVNLEDKLRGMQERLGQAAKIATLGELSAAIAHELGQPLAAVVANGHACQRWLSAQPPNLAKALEAAQRVTRDGQEAGEVVRRIRALFKQAEFEKIQLDLNDVIREVLSPLRSRLTRKDIALLTELTAESMTVAGDRIQLQQLLLNLINNALEAMEPVHGRPRILRVRSGQYSAREVMVEIQDSGVGLNAPDRIFETFFTTKKDGMGMGLAICRTIVEAHDGRLWTSQPEGPGTIFTFALPALSEMKQ